jgi:prevent-host-death family protein
MKIPKNIGITKFRQQISIYFKKVIQGEPVVISNENIQAVLLDLDTYNNLVEAYQDKTDSEILIKSMIKNSGKKKISWEEVQKKLKK